MLQDIRYAIRTLGKSPIKDRASAATAALALALGLGTNVAIFSVVRLMLWTPLPYPHAEQLVYIPQTNPEKGFSSASVSWVDSRDWATASSIASIAVYQTRPVAITSQGDPQHIPAMQVSPGFFKTLGVNPALGRGFEDSESPETEARVAVISHELWQTRFKGDRGVLGRDIRLDDRNYTVVGVMPEGFQFLYQPRDVWVPLSLSEEQRTRGWRGLNAMARLREGVSLAQARDEIRAVSARVGREDPKNGRGWAGDVRPLAIRIMGGGPKVAAGTMFGAVGFVLLIACANVASLLLARGTGRQREFAIRASLGASRASLVRLQLVESVLLALAGGLLGILSAIWTIPMLKRIAPPDMLVLQTASLDWQALAFGFGLSLVTALVFGVVPAWMLSRGDLARPLQEASRGSSGGRHLMLKSLVAGEMALALVLVAASTLMIRSIIAQSTLDPGFDKTNLMTATVLLPEARYPEDTLVAGFYSGVLSNLNRDGSVESAALVQTIPLGGNDNYSNVEAEGEADPGRDKIAGDMIVSPGYFRTMRIPLLAGRDFTDADTADSQKVAIVSETFVKQFWPGVADPLGRRVRMGDQKAPWITVVGVAHDVRHTDLTDPPRPELYRPHAQADARSMILVARGRGSVQNAVGALRTAVWQVDREQPLYRMRSAEEGLALRNAGGRATTQVLGFLAVVALILAAVGTYGVMAYTAAQRLREIGIRLALGATTHVVFRMMLRGGMILAIIGLVIGLPGAYAVALLVRSIGAGLESVSPEDGMAYAGVALLLLSAALVASVVPAWRAMRVDPASVLRQE